MKPIKWQADEVAAHISQLLLAFPELDEDEVLRADMLEGETDLHKVLGHIERARQEALTMASAIDLHILQLKTRAQRFERREEAMRKLIFGLLQMANLRKVELPEATLSIRDGQEKTIITDETALPDEFVHIERIPDKIAIKDALRNGTHVPGAVLSNVEPVLSIRTK